MEMTEGEKKYLIAFVELLIRDAKRDSLDRVLEIIDSETKQTNVGMEERYKRGHADACRFIRHGIERLRGEQE